jgi:hypothetical protein
MTTMEAVANEIVIPRGAKSRFEARNHDKVIDWTDPEEALGEIAYLIKNPPLRSLVVKLSGATAKEVLRLYNTQNRRFKKSIERGIGSVIKSGDFEITGDTVKFGKSGRLLDGQHRLKGTEMVDTPIVTHVVFGLEDNVFDVLDQGKKRTPADILGLSGYEDPSLTASAILWVNTLTTGAVGDRRSQLPARVIRETADQHKDLGKYILVAKQIAKAYNSGPLPTRQPPSLVAALLYVVSRKSEKIADEFAHEWLYGAKVGRNENFIQLTNRLMNSKGGHGGVDSYLRAAILVQTFNHWNAGVVATPRALSWRVNTPFPKLTLDTKEFLRKRDMVDKDDLSDTQKAVLNYLRKNKDAEGNIQISHADIADKVTEEVGLTDPDKNMKINPGSVSFILRALQDRNLVRLLNHPTRSNPGKFHVLSQSEIQEAMAASAAAGEDTIAA